MTVSALVGLQWGDEGKGKIVDHVASSMDVVARGAGGANAGHTIVLDSGEKHVFHLLPSGILQEDVTCVLGAGMAIDPWSLVDEMKQAGLTPETAPARILVSPRAHMVLPYARILEDGLEKLLNIGTTRRGIGPTYAMSALRVGAPMALLAHTEELRHHLEVYHSIITSFGSEVAPWPQEVIESLEPLREWLLPIMGDTTSFLHDAVSSGRRVLLEGAQGVMLDLTHGTYPYVTSSSTTAVGLAAGLGLGARDVGEVLGVVKAYTTRVGEGPFPTEEHGDMGRVLAERGHEFGATTGRPRRCGWLDLVALRWSVRVSGVTRLVVTKLDVLDGMDEIPVCTAYEVPGRGRVDQMPEDPWLFAKVRPVYTTVKGWKSSEGLEDSGVVDYLRMMEDAVGVPVVMASWGPRRSQIMELGHEGVRSFRG